MLSLSSIWTGMRRCWVEFSNIYSQEPPQTTGPIHSRKSARTRVAFPRIAALEWYPSSCLWCSNNAQLCCYRKRPTKEGVHLGISPSHSILTQGHPVDSTRARCASSAMYTARCRLAFSHLAYLCDYWFWCRWRTCSIRNRLNKLVLTADPRQCRGFPAWYLCAWCLSCGEPALVEGSG